MALSTIDDNGRPLFQLGFLKVKSLPANVTGVAGCAQIGAPKPCAALPAEKREVLVGPQFVPFQKQTIEQENVAWPGLLQLGV